MPDGSAPLAATYHLLARLCPPLAVSLTYDNFTPQEYATHRAFDPAAAPPEPGPNPAGVRRTGKAPGACEVRETPGAREARDAPGACEVRDAPGAWGVPGTPGAMNVLDAPDAFVDGEADRVEALHRLRPRRDVAASRFLHHYLWSVGLLFTGPWYLAGRLPSIPPAALTADPATGAFTLATDRVTCGDRCGGTHDGAVALREAVAAYAGPVLEAFAPYVRRGPRALWGMATDDLASGLWSLGRACGEEERGIRAATALLPGGTPPFHGAADFRVLRGPSGRPHPTRTRLGCCLFYAISPAAPCLTCPRLTTAERLRRLEPG